MNPGEAAAPPSRARSFLAFLGWLLLCYAVAALGALASVDAQVFYAAITRPGWAPPGWVFGPVWSVLFTMMACAAWLAWRTPAGAARTRALWLFVAQLAFNGLWSWLFFGWHRGGWALAELVVMWLLIAATLRAFAGLQRTAAWLLAPYLGWVSFAGYLNFVLWRMNPVLLG